METKFSPAATDWRMPAPVLTACRNQPRGTRAAASEPRLEPAAPERVPWAALRAEATTLASPPSVRLQEPRRRVAAPSAPAVLARAPTEAEPPAWRQPACPPKNGIPGCRYG